jgi:putative flippase GtrA
MRDILAKLAQYAVTGGIAAVIDAGGFALLVAAGLNIPFAGCLSFCAAAVVNYMLSSRFVFARQATTRGFALFMAGAFIGLLVNLGVTLAGVYLAGLPSIVAKVVGIGVAFLVNFLINISFVFHAGCKRTAVGRRPFQSGNSS